MPVITIKSLQLDKTVNTSNILSKLTVKTAQAIGYAPEHVWAAWEFLTADNYAVGAKLSNHQTQTTHSPLVRILSFEGTPQATVEKMMQTVAEILAEELNIDIGNIFIEYSEAHSGQIFDGGQVIYSKRKS